MICCHYMKKCCKNMAESKVIKEPTIHKSPTGKVPQSQKDNSIIGLPCKDKSKLMSYQSVNTRPKRKQTSWVKKSNNQNDKKSNDIVDDPINIWQNKNKEEYIMNNTHRTKQNHKSTTKSSLEYFVFIPSNRNKYQKNVKKIDSYSSASTTSDSLESKQQPLPNNNAAKEEPQNVPMWQRPPDGTVIKVPTKEKPEEVTQRLSDSNDIKIPSEEKQDVATDTPSSEAIDSSQEEPEQEANEPEEPEGSMSDTTLTPTIEEEPDEPEAEEKEKEDDKKPSSEEESLSTLLSLVRDTRTSYQSLTLDSEHEPSERGSIGNEWPAMIVPSKRSTGTQGRKKTILKQG